MPQTVEVRFKGTRKAYFRWTDEQDALRLQEAVVVEAEKGVDFGRITAVGEVAEKKCAGACTGCAVGEAKSSEASVIRAVVRRASQQDIRTANDLRRAEEQDRQRIVVKAREMGLPMKISDAEWQWDRSRLTVYFSAEERVDFRALVRDMATMFRTRIELRQIGVRDEAARIGGVGRCGKEFCCSTWLKELTPVSLALAKDQHLSLNPTQISGGCGRLLCCLKYEHEFYVASRKRFPKEGKMISTLRGPERVVAVDIFRERVFLRHMEHGPRIVALVELQEEMAQSPALTPADHAAARSPGRPGPGAPARRDEKRPPRREGGPSAPAAEGAATPPPGRREGRPQGRRGAPAEGGAAAAPSPAQPPRRRESRPDRGAAPGGPATPPPAPAPAAASEGAAPAGDGARKKRRRRRRRGGGPRPEGGAPPAPEA